MNTTMQNCRRGFVRACSVLALVCAAGLPAATEAPRNNVVVWSEQDQWVRIERQDDAAARPNDHPAALDSAAVANALRALRVRPAESAGGAQLESPAFAHEELAQLAPQIAAGLSRAGPRQDVTFSTIGSHALSPGSVMKDPNVNAGRVFYADGKLNVIFGELHANYRKKNVYGQRNQDFEARRQGSRAKAGQQKWALAAGPGVETVRTDWVTIDPNAVGSASAVPAKPATPAAPARPAAAPPVAAPAAPDQTLERRLQVLKDLRDKGLITEEAYEQKVQELLSEL
jgi:hypothetical protein